jgi:hypothetical protein
MNGIADIVDKVGPQSLQVDKDHAFLQYYISKESWDNLVEISTQPNFDGFVVFFGMEDETRYNKLTAIMIGKNDQNNILNEHKTPYTYKSGKILGSLPVDEQNPPPPYADGSKDIIPHNCFTLKSNWKDVEAFFTKLDPQQVPLKNK